MVGIEGGWRKVCVEFCKPYYEPNIIETMESRMMKWANEGELEFGAKLWKEKPASNRSLMRPRLI